MEICRSQALRFPFCASPQRCDDGQPAGNALPLAVLDCTPTRLVLGGAPAGTTGAHFLKITDDGGHFTTFDQELTAA